MAEDQSIPEPDRLEGAPHPRLAPALFGHQTAEAEVLAAIASGRLHHAWLIAGPRGIGKATLAWRIARTLAAMPTGGGLFGAPEPPATLDVPQDHPVWRRAAALSEPAIHLCRRGWDDKAKRLKTQLTVDEIRKLKSTFALSAPDGGHRVAIIDSADEMNPSAANALLKLLEEPPAKTTLLLVAHQPARLLPTIRSRCRVLKLAPLSGEDLARALLGAGQELDDLDVIGALAGGSVGEAIRLAQGGVTEVFPRIIALLMAAPAADRGQLATLAQSAVGRDNAPVYEMILGLTLLIIARLARAAAGAPGDLLPPEQALAARLGTPPGAARGWAAAHASLAARAGHARAVNLDPEQVILDMFLAIETTAARILRAAA